MAKTGNGNRPVYQVRNRRLKAAIWANESPKGKFYSVTLTRSFRKDDQWHDSTSFNFDDLPNLAKLAYDAHSAISTLLIKDKEEIDAKPPPVRRKP